MSPTTFLLRLSSISLLGIALPFLWNLPSAQGQLAQGQLAQGQYMPLQLAPGARCSMLPSQCRRLFLKRDSEAKTRAGTGDRIARSRLGNDRFFRGGQQSLDNVILVRPYRGKTQVGTVRREGTPLIRVLQKTEGEIRLLEQLEYEYAVSDAGNPYAPSFQNPFIYTGISRSDTILVVRNHEILVIPRILLAHPLVQFARVRPGDVVATLGSDRSGSRAESGRDMFFPALSARENSVKRNERMLPVVAFDSVFEPEAVVRAKAEMERYGAMTVVSDLHQSALSPTGLEKSLIEERAEQGLSQPVFLVVRSRGPFVITYVIPFKYSGPLSNHGALFATLFSVSSQDILPRRWDQAMNGLLTIEFEAEDGVWVTRLERVPFFQSGLH